MIVILYIHINQSGFDIVNVYFLSAFHLSFLFVAGIL